MIHGLVVFSQKGEALFEKWYMRDIKIDYTTLLSDLFVFVNNRDPTLPSFAFYHNSKIVYKVMKDVLIVCITDKYQNGFEPLMLFDISSSVFIKKFKKFTSSEIMKNLNIFHMIIDEIIVGGEINNVSELLVSRAISDVED